MGASISFQIEGMLMCPVKASERAVNARIVLIGVVEATAPPGGQAGLVESGEQTSNAPMGHTNLAMFDVT